MLPLATYSLIHYKYEPSSCFKIKGGNDLNPAEISLQMKMHKAISVIQFKLEGQLLMRRKEFHMANRALLDSIDYANGTIRLDGKEYKLLDSNFPTIDPDNPYELSSEEALVVERLNSAFTNCEKLQRHMNLLLKKGSLYKVYNNNLLYHGCIPLNEDGSFKAVDIYGKKYKGKALYEVLEILWFIWSSPGSPLFGNQKMATFERYFLAEKETHEEKKNPYYRLLEDETVINRIMREFGLEEGCAHIVNGHVPVHHAAGESPIKCNG